MYISEIKIHGFKSFAQKEVLKLGQGITAIVGPNGCGKTNIIDAVRWVLGEQKYSVLRGARMEDVIFNGTEGVKPLSVCQVTMIVHNNSGKLPIEYNDIEITRRVYRDGISEYFLNKIQCRLKDILNLFVDTGMGSDAYSVIELKMIEQILSESGDDRKKMFEEASGINKYRKQRTSTIKRFERTRRDIERVNDIINEVEQKVLSSKLQLKRFNRHASLSQALKKNEINLAFVRQKKDKLEVDNLIKELKEYDNIRNKKKNQTVGHEKDLEKHKLIYQKEETQLEEIQVNLSKLDRNRENFLSEVIMLTEKNRGIKLNIDRLINEFDHNINKRNLLIDTKKEYKKTLMKLRPAFLSQLKLKNKFKKKVHIKEELFKRLKKDVDKEQEKKWCYKQKIDKDNSIYNQTKAMLKEKDNKIIEVKRAINGFKENKEQLEESLKVKKYEEKKLLDGNNKITSFLKKNKDKLESLILKRDSLIEKKYQIKSQLKSAEEKLLFYNELIKSRDGFPEGTKYILENSRLFPAILGTVADIFKIEKKYQKVLEVALGELSHCIITKNRNIALKILKLANQNNTDDFTILALEDVKRAMPKLKNIPKSNLLISRASELIKTSNNLKPIADYLLGNILIVSDLKLASSSNIFFNWNIVDENGSYLGTDLVLKNRKLLEYSHILGRQEKVDNLFNELEKKSKVEKLLKKKLKKLNDIIMTFGKKNKLYISNKEKHTDRILELNNDIIQKNISYDQVINKIKSMEKDLKILNKEVKEKNEEVSLLKPKINKIKEDSFNHDKVIKEKLNQVHDHREERDEYQEQLNKSKINLIEIENKINQIKFKISSTEESVTELNIRYKEIEKEIRSLKVEKKLNSKKNKVNNDGLEEVNIQIQKNSLALDFVKTKFKESYHLIQKVQNKITLDQISYEKVLDSLKLTELKLEKKNQRIIQVKDKIKDKYNQKIPINLTVSDSKDILLHKIEKIQKSIDNIGPVNMEVQEQYSQDKNRLKLLKDQKEDLIVSEKNILKTIDKVDKVARSQFIKTFKLIKKNFSRTFKLLFEGGNASLDLIGDTDPLESEIQINAQPPGKRNTSIRLLSSGEKALTAIGLLFSIYQVKPSPYCILDEIDAPLDDINIQKFTRVLKSFCEETQFIIVTHNKLTMEIADYLYGVTQEIKGISKLVSVKFE
jgi:chromosome segregation protein